jgi:hypothetical protein
MEMRRNMKKLLLLGLLLFGISAFSQVSQNLTAQAAACGLANSTGYAFIQVGTAGGVAIGIDGTFSGTLSFYGSASQGTTWQALNVTPSNSGTAVTTTTGTGAWQVNTAGYNYVCVLFSTYSSGTATVTLTKSVASARAGGGSGGSGTVTSVTFTGDGVVDSSTPSTAVTTTGTVTATVKNQTQNTVLAGSNGGGTIAPTFRALVNADLPGSGATTVQGQSCALAGSCNINSVTTAHGVALNEGSATRLGGTAAGGANFPLIGQAAADPIWSTIAYPTSVTSGGLCYGSAASVISCSPLIAANAILKAGGAGAAPLASGMSDTGTVTVTTEIFKSGNTQLLTADASGITATTPGTIVFTWGALPANRNYPFHCEIIYSQSTAAVAGDGIAVQGATNAPTRLDAWGKIDVTDPASTNYTGSAGSLLNLNTTTATSVVTATPGASGTVYQATLSGLIQVGASASTFNVLMFTGNVSDAVVPKAGSFCTLMF